MFELLRQHPDIYLPPCKETGFFLDDEEFVKGLPWYKKQYFSNWKGENAVGEITPLYMYSECVPQRIRTTLGGEVKLLFIFRNPVDRAYSEYWAKRGQSGKEDKGFRQAIEKEPHRIKRGFKERMDFSYIDKGFYSEQLERFLEYFPKSNMHFMVFENFVKKMPIVMKDLFLFLGVSANPKKNLNYQVKANPARKTRSKTLKNLLFNPSEFEKRFARMLIPSQTIRHHLVQSLIHLNQKNIEKPSLDKRLRK